MQISGVDNLNAPFFKEFRLFPGAEIGINYIQVNQHNLFVSFLQKKRKINGEFRLSTPIIPGKNANSLMLHIILLKNISTLYLYISGNPVKFLVKYNNTLYSKR